MASEPRLVEVRRNVLKKNDLAAAGLRQNFRDAGVSVISLVSSPGSGKTAFLEKTLTELQPQYRVAALVGDLATDNDAARLARSKALVQQITTGTVCHLEAEMIRTGVEAWNLARAGFPVHRERRQPGVPVVLRSGRGAAAGAALGDRRRGQAS